MGHNHRAMATYRVVGCSDCGALWVLSGRPETSRCPRCGTRHRFSKLKAFHETDDENEAREYRAAMLAERQGAGDAFAQLEDFATLERRAAEAGVDDEAYLAESGLDPGEVAGAGERAEQGTSGGSASRKDVVREALQEQDAPTERDVVTYAEARGVPAEAARDLLEKLRRTGEVAESGGTLRLL